MLVCNSAYIKPGSLSVYREFLASPLTRTLFHMITLVIIVMMKMMRMMRMLAMHVASLCLVCYSDNCDVCFEKSWIRTIWVGR